jgi:hypothetical protein
MPGSPAKSLTSTVASPPDTEIPASHFRQGAKETVIPRVLTSDQTVCSPTTRCRIAPAGSAR